MPAAMRAAIGWATQCAVAPMLFALSQQVSAATESVLSVNLDSPAQAAVRKFAASGANMPLQPVSPAQKAHDETVARLDEIRVYGRSELEDYVGRRPSPLMQFRARLEKDVRWSPAKKVRMALCLIGLCANYGAEGIPLGDSPEVRAEARLRQSALQVNGQFRGTLQ